ncbi:MAG: YihY/virulence factor BrkB family protein [Oscillospiraceae bacterium]|nr:YihY/virulence factor BrkB family protein [Oscillospiraceae bacterium]
MKKFSFSDSIDKLARLVLHLARQKVTPHAAATGYFIVLSVFPLLVLVLAVLRYTGLQVETLTDLLEGFLPAALMSAARRLILSTYQNTSGTVVSLSALTGLWSASRGIYGLLTGLNAIYGVKENRGYFYTRAVSVVYTFLFLLMLVATLVLNVFGTTLLQMLPLQNVALLQFLWELTDWRFLLMLLLQTALFSTIFMALPNCRNTFRQSLPGAVLASLGWLIFSDLYSVYVQHFSGYANIYGSVYGIAFSMLWLYFCLSIVFYGGALNHYLKEKKQTP